MDQDVQDQYGDIYDLDDADLNDMAQEDFQ